MKSILIILMMACAFMARAQSLEDYFKAAADNNPGLQAEYKEFEAALQKVPQVSTLPDPSLSVSAFGQMIETRVGPQQARFSLSQMFPWFGTLRAQGDVAALAAEARLQSYFNARNKLYNEVAETYYMLYGVEQQMVIQQKNIEVLESFKTIATSRFENGKGSLADVLRADIVLKGAGTGLVILEKERHPLTVRFNRLLNRPDSAAIAMPDSTGMGFSPPPSDSTATWLQRHPMVAGLELMEQRSKAAEYAARKQGMPMLGVGIDYVIVGKRMDAGAPPDNGKDAIMPMVSVSLPVFRKKYRAAIREEQIMQESYRLRQQEVINTLSADIEAVLFELSRQQELTALYGEQVAATRQTLRLLLTAYGNSGAGFDEVLMMQQRLLEFEEKAVDALVSYLAATAKYNYLIAKEY